MIANAEGDAARFKLLLTEYAKAPQVTRERIYIDTMREILSANSKIMMDYRGAGNLLMLPLAIALLATQVARIALVRALRERL